MKPVFLSMVIACNVLILAATAADATRSVSRLSSIDAELALEEYRQVRMEQFRAEMQLNLIPTDENVDDATRKGRGEQLRDRRLILQRMAEEVRARIIALEAERGRPSDPKLAEQSSALNPAPTIDGNNLKKRMLGTWQLISFADGRVSDANVGELKFIGDRHWSVSRLQPSTGRLDYHMGGTYTLEGNQYVETIEYGTGGPIGQTFTYKLTVEGDKFVQTGVENPWSLIFRRAK
jgi:hypothetical protein